MHGKLKRKNTMEEVWEKDLDKYLGEMDILVNKYPEDPNAANLTEQKLCRLIEELDESWMSLQKKWQRRIKVAGKVPVRGLISKDNSGMRHLIIKSELNDDNILDLVVPNPENK